MYSLSDSTTGISPRSSAAGNDQQFRRMVFVGVRDSQPVVFVGVIYVRCSG